MQQWWHIDVFRGQIYLMWEINKGLGIKCMCLFQPTFGYDGVDSKTSGSYRQCTHNDGFSANPVQ